MAYTSHMLSDTQLPSSLPFNARLSLFGGDLSCSWKELCHPNKAMASISSSSKTKLLGLQPVITRQIQTLASLESNYETSESDEEQMEEERNETDEAGEELSDAEEMEGDSEAEVDDDNDDDDNYVEFCSLLSKSPTREAAASRFIHASFITSSFSFSVTNDEDSSDDDDAGDDRDATSENDSDEDEFGWSAPQPTCYGGFDPFAVSGLFMPSLLSAITSCSPPVIHDETSCNSSNDYGNNDDESKEFAQKLKDANKRWSESYSTSIDDISAMADGENCITSAVNRVTCKRNVHFCDKTMFIDVLNKEEWAEDYEVARKGPWEQYHRDHVRFEHRIESMRELLSDVLVAEHRASVFQKLYETTELVTNDQDSMMDLLQALPAS